MSAPGVFVVVVCGCGAEVRVERDWGGDGSWLWVDGADHLPAGWTLTDGPRCPGCAEGRQA